MEKKEQGFTLIELLAVIVILAVIALIVTPVITDIIDSTELSAFVQSGNSIVSAVEAECSTSIIKNGNKNIAYNFGDDEPQKISVKGKLPTSGGVMTNDKCRASLNISDGKYCAIKSANSNEVIGGKVEDGICKVEETKTTSAPANTDPNPGEFRGTGTAEDPYLVESVEDLFVIQTLTWSNTDGKIFKLATDLDLKDDNSYGNPNSIAYGDINGDSVVNGIKEEVNSGKGFSKGLGYQFAGSFDGNNKTIKNLYINNTTVHSAGLFGYVSPESTDIFFKDLTLENVNIISTNSYVGSLIGELGSSKKVELSNIHAVGTISAYGTIGGIVGKIGIASSSTIDNLSFNGTIISQDGYNGGIFGYTAGLPASGLSHLKSNVKILTVKGNTAGIVGSCGSVDMSDIYAYGQIIVNPNATRGDSITSSYGGIIGNGLGGTAKMTNVYNYMDINLTKARQVGGIMAGSLPSGENIFNYGNITIDDESASGLCFSIDNCNNCHNYGNITAKRSAGGLAVYIDSEDIYTNSENHGIIKTTE